MKVVFNKGTKDGHLSLSDLRNGERAAIASVDCGLATRGRLLELGLTPGTSIEFIRRAPMGDPILIRLRGYDLSLGAVDARKISVERETM